MKVGGNINPSDRAYEMFSVKTISFDGKKNVAIIENRYTRFSEDFVIFMPHQIDKAATLGFVARHFLSIKNLLNEEAMYTASAFDKHNDGVNSLYGFISGIISYEKSIKIGMNEDIANLLLLNQRISEELERCRQLLLQQS